MQFDPQAFLDATLTEPTVKRPPLPIGDYTAQIGEIKSRTWQGKKDPTQSGVALDLELLVDVPPEVMQAIGLAKSPLTLRDSIMLDLTEGGMIDNGPGKNSRLRKYREALDMNKPGDTFSPRRMQGGIVKVKVGHELWNGDPTEKIDGVAAA